MPFQSVPNTAKFEARFSDASGRTASFGLYANDDLGNWDAEQMNDHLVSLRTAVEDEYMPYVSNEWTFTGVTGRDLEPRFGRYMELAASGVVVGALNNPKLPASVSVVATFIGQPANPPNRGRIHLLSPSESQVTGNALTAGAVADLQGAAEALHNAMSSIGPAHVIVSRHEGYEYVGDEANGTRKKRAALRAVGVTNEVQSVIVHSRVDSQRKRLPRE